MSTRAGIIIKDKYSQSHYYRHSDGYPEGTMPALEKFLSWVKQGKIRDNTSQSAGWLIIIGALEYNTIPLCEFEKDTPYSKGYGKIETIQSPSDWKAGAFEPTSNINRHRDLEYIYIIDLISKTISYKEV